MTDEDRPAWVLWQIRALWREVHELRTLLEQLIRRLDDE